MEHSANNNVTLILAKVLSAISLIMLAAAAFVSLGSSGQSSATDNSVLLSAVLVGFTLVLAPLTVMLWGAGLGSRQLIKTRSGSTISGVLMALVGAVALVLSTVVDEAFLMVLQLTTFFFLTLGLTVLLNQFAKERGLSKHAAGWLVYVGALALSLGVTYILVSLTAAI